MEETQESNVTQTTFPENFPGHLRHNRGLTRELYQLALETAIGVPGSGQSETGDA